MSDRQPDKLTRLAFEVNTAELLEAEISFRALGNALTKLSRRAKRVEIPPFRKNATRKMKNMILSFAINITDTAMLNTPIGDIQKIDEKTNFRYWEMYDVRADAYGIEMIPGFHQSSWRYSETKNPVFDPEIYGLNKAEANVIKDFKLNYKIGDTFYIAAKGPAFGLMESGVIDTPSQGGIVQPTIQQVMATYKVDMMAAYARRA